MIIFDEKICGDIEGSTSREWLETNGIGGSASGTISGINTRRYHSLLTAATRPPLGRVTTVAKIEETVVLDGAAYELSSNHYPGTISPKGYELIASFRLDPYPVWTYSLPGIELEKRIFMVHGRNATVVQYKARSLSRQRKAAAIMKVRPLLAMTDHHHIRHETSSFRGELSISPGVVSMHPVEEFPALFFAHNGRSVEPTGFWYRNFDLSIEKERGFEHYEDLFQPFELTFGLGSGADLIVATDRAIDAAASSDLEKAEQKRRKSIIKKAGAKSEIEKRLALAADQFIVERGEGHTIIAGYPWFSDWGRDTMISLPGLTLETGRPEIARGILSEFARHVSEGMLPNRFPDRGEGAEYNTVDATLWYFEAVRAYVEKTGDTAFVRDELYPTLASILASHLRGTRYNIHVDTDGLLYAGEPGQQLTWMDAKIGDLVITPRTGKAVEIQALWYNALRIMEGLAAGFGDDEDRSRYASMADLAKLSFNAVFWNEEDDCLFDVVENGTRSAEIRPNQIFAASLSHSMLDDDRARRVVKKVEELLFTPVGLRTLSPKDPAYVPVYIGGPVERDSAYHQGTVWPWLMGAFVDACRRVRPDAEPATRELYAALEAHLWQAGVGQVSEIFDADMPHHPRGCPAQAWSVAELIRMMQKR